MCLNDVELRRRGGVFQVSEPNLFKAAYRRVLSEFLVLGAQYRWDLRGVEYTALHERLPVTAEGIGYPSYRICEHEERAFGRRLYLLDESGNTVLEWFV